jgi:two-component system sensor histidine kinase AlgZ
LGGADETKRDSQVFLPDFCAPGTILVVLLVAELIAILLTIADKPAPGTFLTELAMMSLFILWLALLSDAVMCHTRHWIEDLGPSRAFVGAFLILLVLCLVLAEIAYRLTMIFGASAIIGDTHGSFLLRTFAISAIVIALAMRYLYISSEWRRSIVLEAQARVSALQALMKPHFLFNSMNTIAALTRSDPARAEEAVEDLADLLRANLGSQKERNTLKEELEVAAIYQRIETLRLGDRLRVRWDIDQLPMCSLIPSLTIQPLLENAIYHGIELLPEGGEVVISGRRDGDMMSISVANPVVALSHRKKSGNKIALKNIRQRFEIAYGGKAKVSTDDSGRHFAVNLTFPCEEPEA